MLNSEQKYILSPYIYLENDKDDIYIINSKTLEIYYLKGVIYSEGRYYTIEKWKF